MVIRVILIADNIIDEALNSFVFLFKAIIWLDTIWIENDDNDKNNPTEGNIIDNIFIPSIPNNLVEIIL